MGSSLAGAVRERLDGLFSALMGYGTSRDKRTSWRVAPSRAISPTTLENYFHGSDLAAKVCEALPAEALRQGFEVEVDLGDGEEDEQAESELESELATVVRDLGMVAKAESAAVWARNQGLAALLPGVDDGQTGPDVLAQPLREDAIRSVSFLTVLEGQQLHVTRYYDDPASPKYGQPELYSLTGELAYGPGTMTGRVPGGPQALPFRGPFVHESRLITFPGARTSTLARQRNGGRDHSVLQPMWETIQDVETMWIAAAHLMQDASQASFTIKGLMDMILSGQKDVLQTRMELMDMARSSARAILLDDGEAFERHATPFSGIPEMLDRSMARLAAAARMPQTVLWGQAPAGLNATGESDMRVWYDQVRAWQTHVLTPRLERLMRLVLLSSDGPTQGELPEKWSIEYPPLWQPTEKEIAETRKLRADEAQVYVTMGALLPEEVALGTDFPSSYAVDEAHLQEQLDLAREADAKRAEMVANPPVLPVPTPPGTNGAAPKLPAPSEQPPA